MTSTFAQVLEAASANDQEVVAYIDSAVPAGHFVAISSKIDDGDQIIYLLEGRKNDPDARVKGYILKVSCHDTFEAYGYAQDVQTGEEKPLGQLHTYRGKTESFESAFAQMA